MVIVMMVVLLMTIVVVLRGIVMGAKAPIAKAKCLADFHSPQSCHVTMLILLGLPGNTSIVLECPTLSQPLSYGNFSLTKGTT